MWVVKLGGSLLRDAQRPAWLPQWLAMLAEFGAGRVTLVPGGAAFADCVREAQAQWGFDDLAAHNMAVLAMAQTAQMLHSLEPRFVLATQDSEIRRALHDGHPALWQPYTVLRDAPDVLTSWEVTGDSLALWLARRLNAERLVVVKSCHVESLFTLGDMTARGVLDARFAEWARDAPFPIEVVRSEDVAIVRDALLGCGAPHEGMSPAAPLLGAIDPVRTGSRGRARRKPPAV